MDNKKKRLLLVCNESNSTINFRKELIGFLLSKDYEIFVTAGDSERKEEIEKLGVTFIETTFNNRSKNPLSLNAYKKTLFDAMSDIKPDIVFSFQLKPNIVAPKVAHKFGIENVYCMVEGLGDPFQPKNPIQLGVRSGVSFLMKRAFKFVKKVFVLNTDDKEEIIARKIANPDNVVLIPGIGIDTNAYQPSKTASNNIVVRMFARLIKSKGIIDYCKVAKIVHKKRSDIEFELYGQEQDFTAKKLKKYTDKGYIKYCGYSKQSKELMASSRLVVSTSAYREGMPRVLLETMSLGKTVVASNTVGSKDLVINGETGFLFGVHNVEECAEIILEIIDNDKLLVQIGENARKICESKYDSKIINQTIFEIINQ